MSYRRELLDMKNPEDYRLALKMFYICSKPKDPEIVFLYFKEFGVHSEEEKSELNRAKFQIKAIKSHIRNLEGKFEKMPEDVDEIIYKTPPYLFWPYIRAVKKGSEHKPKNERKIVYL